MQSSNDKGAHICTHHIDERVCVCVCVWGGGGDACVCARARVCVCVRACMQGMDEGVGVQVVDRA